jgi:hypothetical protein
MGNLPSSSEHHESKKGQLNAKFSLPVYLLPSLSVFLQIPSMRQNQSIAFTITTHPYITLHNKEAIHNVSPLGHHTSQHLINHSKIMLSFLPAYELSLLQRLLLIWLFIICGLVLGLQASQHYAENPSKRWFLTQDTK